MLDALSSFVKNPLVSMWWEGEKQQVANKFNSSEAISAYNRSREARQTAYQDTMSDLKAAGLNPMLAINNGVTQLPSSMAASYPVGAGAASANVLASARSAGASEVSADASASQASTASRLADETVRKTRQEVENLRTDQERVKALTDNLRVMRDNLIKEGFNLTDQGNQIRATVSKLMAEVPYLRSQAFLAEARAELAKVDASLGRLDIEAATQSNNIGRYTREYGPAAQILLEILREGFNRGHRR